MGGELDHEIGNALAGYRLQGVLEGLGFCVQPGAVSDLISIVQLRWPQDRERTPDCGCIAVRVRTPP